MTLATLLPVPLMLAVPSSDRFSKLVSQREGDLRVHGVGALVRQFRDNVTDRVHEVHVIAFATDHRVVATATVDRVVTGQSRQAVVLAVAGHHVVQGVAGAFCALRPWILMSSTFATIVQLVPVAPETNILSCPSSASSVTTSLSVFR
jgi:hypothetical protein